VTSSPEPPRPLPELPVRVLPSPQQLLDGAVQYRLPLRSRFRGIDVREGLLLHGPCGWGEFAPFAEYDAAESARWLAAAVEASHAGWPPPVRDRVPVNAIVPAVAPDVAAAIATSSGCHTIKVKVAQPGQSLVDDVARLAAVRAAVGPVAALRIDANGGWTVDAALTALAELTDFDLEYVEQPCATVAECAQLRRRIDLPLAIDEGIRKAADPRSVADLAAAADLLVLKVAPLGGVRPALAVAAAYGMPCVVSSALDSSVGLAAGLALAAALPDLPYACGLGSGLLLAADVTEHPLLPLDGVLSVRTVDDVTGGPVEPIWRERLVAAHAVLAADPGR
jgi:O-succinylbenzoate synthase